MKGTDLQIFMKYVLDTRECLRDLKFRLSFCVYALTRRSSHVVFLRVHILVGWTVNECGPVNLKIKGYFALNVQTKNAVLMKIGVLRFFIFHKLTEDRSQTKGPQNFGMG